MPVRPRCVRWQGPVTAGLATFLVLAPASAATTDADAARGPATRHVLFLNSYQPGYTWSDDLFSAVNNRLSRQPYPVELWVEYLDTRRYAGADYEDELLHLIRFKYGARRLNLIVSSDDAALQFLLRHHDALFPGVPVVFCGVNDETLAASVPRSLYTGVRELFGNDEIVALATALRPGTTHFVVVSDATDTSVAALEGLRTIAGSRPALSFTFLDGRTRSLDAILEELAAVPSDAAVIATSFTRDATGQYYPRGEAMRSIAEASPAPVYSPSVSELGQGLLAGSENGGLRHGRLAAEYAVKVLDGVRPANLPIAVDKVRRFPVDWTQLTRWQIDPQRLPPQAFIVNRPVTFYATYRTAVWLVSGFMLMQAAIIAALIVNIRRRRSADRALQSQAANLQTANAKLEDANESLVREMTERRQAEEHLRQAQKIDAVGRLAGGIAHDFNNLLTVIVSYSELALERLPAADPVRAQVREIQRASVRAASLTQQLLAFSRKQVLQPSLVSLNAVITGVLPMLQRLIREDVTLTTRLAPDLDAVLVDPGQIEQALVNLVVNARDAMPAGGRLSIETANEETVSAEPAQQAGMVPARYVVLSVSDSGHGMDAETRAHIFEPFYTTKPAGHGTGLGLAMVYGFVKQSGGWIWVSSEPRQGTTFKIYLPPATAAGNVAKDGLLGAE
jgi:signal transduction histidine kinase